MNSNGYAVLLSACTQRVLHYGCFIFSVGGIGLHCNSSINYNLWPRGIITDFHHYCTKIQLCSVNGFNFIDPKESISPW